MATRRNPWPFSRPKPAPKRRGTGARQPTRREMGQQLRNAHQRALRAVERIEQKRPGTYEFEEAVRLGRLAQRHLEQVERKAYELHQIEPEGRRGPLSRLLGGIGPIRRKREREALRRQGEGLDAILKRVSAPRAAPRTRTTESIRTARTRAYQPIKAGRAGRARGTTPAVSGADAEEIRRKIERGEYQGTGGLAGLLDQLGGIQTKKRKGA